MINMLCKYFDNGKCTAGGHNYDCSANPNVCENCYVWKLHTTKDVSVVYSDEKSSTSSDIKNNDEKVKNNNENDYITGLFIIVTSIIVTGIAYFQYNLSILGLVLVLIISSFTFSALGWFSYLIIDDYNLPNIFGWIVGIIVSILAFEIIAFIFSLLFSIGIIGYS